MKQTITAKLSIMMFLEFFIWGGWFVTLGSFLQNNLAASDSQSAMAFSTQSWGAIIAPFIIGLIADRFFNAERILGFLHLFGAVMMYQMYSASGFSNFYPYTLAYMIAYMPTLALVNSVSFNQMKNPSKEFPVIRVFGTIGWVIAGLMISFIFRWDSTDAISQGFLKNTFLMTAVASLLLGLFSFTLPKTPPQNKDNKSVKIGEILGFDALKLLQDRNYLIFFISSILICIPLAFYYQNISLFLTETKVDNSTGITALGQLSEILMMLLLPLFFTKYGFKRTILFGMFAWVLRYLLFSFGAENEVFAFVIIGILLHGICYDFFFVSGQIYTDSKAGDKIKSAAQGLITLATYGLGMLIGFAIAGKVSAMYLDDGLHIWSKIWMFPAIFAAVVFFFFLLFFKKEEVKYGE